MPTAEPKPNPKPTEKDVNAPQQQEENFDRDGRERYPNEQADSQQGTQK